MREKVVFGWLIDAESWNKNVQDSAVPVYELSFRYVEQQHDTAQHFCLICLWCPTFAGLFVEE